MTLSQLEYFQTIAKLQHYRQAAEVLMISQPSLSRSMAALEEELGLVLFEKSGRNVILTKPGHILLEHADRILSEIHTAKYRMRQLANGDGHIDIAYVFPLASYYIPRTVRAFLDEKPNRNITFTFNQSHTAEMVAGLKAGKHDIIFCSHVKNEPDITFVPVLQQDMVVISPKSHPLSESGTVSYRELTQYPVIGYDRFSVLGGFTNQFYEQYNLNVNIICECPDENTIAALVAEQFGIALVANVDALKNALIEILPLEDIELKHTVYMGYLKERYRTPAVKRFIHFINERQN